MQILQNYCHIFHFELNIIHIHNNLLMQELYFEIKKPYVCKNKLLIMKQKFTLILVTILTTVFVVNKSSAQITNLNAIKALCPATGVYTFTSGQAMLNAVIISDTINKNVSAANAVLQANGTGAIIYFGKGAGHVYNVGDSISINLTGWGITLYQGAYEFTPPKGTTTFPAPVATGIMITPQEVTVDYINKNYNTIAYTLVIIHHAGINSTTGIFSGANNIADATGSLIVYTGSSSTFKDSMPSTDTLDYIGYVVIYKVTTPEFSIRSFSDIKFALPLSFKAFAVEAKGNTALLTWNTANEVNTNKFVIEKSIDGSSFSSLNSILSKGKATNSYAFTDAGNKTGSVAYYRLKSIDKSGSFAYSNVQKVVFSAATKVSAYPNPTLGFTKLSYSTSATDAIARVIAADGKLVKQVILKAGTNTTDLQLSSLAKGVYTIETGNTAVKVIKN